MDIYIHTHVYIHLDVYTSTYVSRYLYMHTHICLYAHIRTHAQNHGTEKELSQYQILKIPVRVQCYSKAEILNIIVFI